MFPPLNVQSYQMALLQNRGGRHLTFSLDHNMYSTLAETVAVVPSCGVIYPGSHQILILRSTTDNSLRQEFSIPLLLNAAENAMVLYTEYTDQR